MDNNNNFTTKPVKKPNQTKHVVISFKALTHRPHAAALAVASRFWRREKVAALEHDGGRVKVQVRGEAENHQEQEGAPLSS